MKKEIRLFDNPKNIKRLRGFFYIFLAFLLVADFFIHKHADFPWEGHTNFFAAYGFVSYVLLICIAKILRRIIKRREDYYDTVSEDS